jgi:hypothetical protein
MALVLLELHELARTSCSSENNKRLSKVLAKHQERVLYIGKTKTSYKQASGNERF